MLQRAFLFAALLVSFVTTAQGATVVFDGNRYTIGLANSGSFTSLNALGAAYEDAVIRNQPWANSNAIALLFMGAVGNDLGLNIGSTSDYGPFFVTYETGLNAAVYRSDGSSGIGAMSRNSSGTFAIVTDVSAVPLPAAAWLFGSALLGLGVIKRKKA